jgi:hypothetical protein
MILANKMDRFYGVLGLFIVIFYGYFFISGVQLAESNQFLPPNLSDTVLSLSLITDKNKIMENNIWDKDHLPFKKSENSINSSGKIINSLKTKKITQHWILKAIAQTITGEKFAIIQLKKSKKTVRIYLGEVLPSGEILHSIDSYSIATKTGQVIQLFTSSTLKK